MYLHKRLSEVQSLFYQLSVLFEEGAEEQAEVLNEVLLVIFTVCICQPDVGVQWKHLQHTRKKGNIRLAQDQLVYGNCTSIYTREELTCLSCIMVRVKRLTNCSSYWLTLTPAISVKHFSVTLRNIGTFKNYRSTQERRGVNNYPKDCCFVGVKYNLCSSYCMNLYNCTISLYNKLIHTL